MYFTDAFECLLVCFGTLYEAALQGVGAGWFVLGAGVKPTLKATSYLEFGGAFGYLIHAKVEYLGVRQSEILIF